MEHHDRIGIALQGLQVAGLLIAPRSRRCVDARRHAEAACARARGCRRSRRRRPGAIPSTHSVRDRLDGALEGPHGVHRRHHHDHLAGGGRSVTAAPPRRRCPRGGPRDLGDRAASGGHREEGGAGRERERAAPACNRRAARLAAADGVVEVGAAREGRPTMPWSQPNRDLTAAPVADPGHRRQSRASAARSSRASAGRCTRWRGRSRWNQRSPNARAWRLAVFGTATTQHTAATQVSACVVDRGARSAVGARARARRRSPTTRRRGSVMSASRTSGRRGSRSSPTLRRPRAARASSRAPSPAPTSSTGPGGARRSTRVARRARVRRSSVVGRRRRSVRTPAGTGRRRPRARVRPAMDPWSRRRTPCSECAPAVGFPTRSATARTRRSAPDGCRRGAGQGTRSGCCGPPSPAPI